jgi:hypothetical protein
VPAGVEHTGIFAPRPDGYIEVPLLDGERLIRQQTASYLVNGKAIWGGQLVLTSQRLLFRPLDLNGLSKIAKDGIELLPDDLAVFGKVVDKVLDYSTAYGNQKAGAVATSLITSVRPGRNAGLLHPPSLVLTMSDGRQLEIGILHSLTSMNPLPINNVARDETVAAISAQLAVR